MSALTKRHRLTSADGQLSIDAPDTPDGLTMLNRIRHDFQWFHHGKVYGYTPAKGEMPFGKVYVTGTNPDLDGDSILSDAYNISLGLGILDNYKSHITLEGFKIIRCKPANIALHYHCVQCLEALNWVIASDENWTYVLKGN
jgi:hypothetical protein